MRIRMFPLLFLSLSLASSSAFSLPKEKKQLDQKYAYNQTLTWDQKLPQPVLELLNKGKFQEAIWLLEDDNREDDAFPIKKFLRDTLVNGQIYSDGIISLGGGVTDTKLVYLPHGVKAVLKMKSMHPSSNYSSEIAAYDIDQLGKFALVPMTVLRKHKGSVASLQYFVEGARDANKASDYEKTAKLNIFDYLVRNQDRTLNNVMLLGEREVAIDHGLALRPNSVLGGFLRFTDKTKIALGIAGDRIRLGFVFPKDSADPFRAELRIIEALKQLTWSKMARALHPNLNMDTIIMVWKKKEKLLKALDETISQ